jgi:hypothetical protein
MCVCLCLCLCVWLKGVIEACVGKWATMRMSVYKSVVEGHVGVCGWVCGERN